MAPYRFFFVSQDAGEPPLVHVQREASVAKFWLAPVRLAKAGGFDADELNTVGRLVQDHWQWRLEQWDEFFRH